MGYIYVGGGTDVTYQEKGLLDWRISDVNGWSCSRLGRAIRLVTAGGDFGSVIVRVVSRQLTVPTDCYMGGRWSCGSAELIRVKIYLFPLTLLSVGWKW